MSTLDVVLRIKDHAVESALYALVESCGLSPKLSQQSEPLSAGPLLCSSLIFLETGDDVPALVSEVQTAYDKCKHSGTMWIVGVLSLTAISENPFLSSWHINGHAAVLGLLEKDSPDFDQNVRSLCYHFQRITV